MKLLIINGPNINMLGIREKHIYGSNDYACLLKLIDDTCKEQSVDYRHFQSNFEGEIVTEIQKAYGIYDCIIINPAAYTHTSIAILDALKAVSIPTVEVHISDIESREEFRKFSYVSLYAEKTIVGKGLDGYREAILYAVDKYSSFADSAELKIRSLCRDPHKVFFYDSTDSTNIRAAEYIRSGNAKGGEVFIAKKQELGRGTKGRSFFSDDGLYMSVIYHPDDGMRNLTAFASVCVSRALDSLYGVNCEIKWVNDVLVSGKKICGILCEALYTAGNPLPDFVIIGIGINTRTESFPEDIANTATSLKQCGIDPDDDAMLVATIVSELERNAHSFMTEYRLRSATIGKYVSVVSIDGKEKKGTAIDIDEDGALVLETDEGTEKILHGDVFAL